MTTTTIIEKRDIGREYGFNGVEAIIDHPKYGRLLISDGFGCVDSLDGGAVRFKHGMVIKLDANETFERLDKQYQTPIDIAYDKKVMNWDGFMIDKVAKSAGLI